MSGSSQSTSAQCYAALGPLLLHMLSTMTRKFVSLSVMSYLLLTDLSQLLIAPMRLSNLDARFVAALSTDLRLSWLPVSSQSCRSAGCVMKPKSCVLVLSAMICNGAAHALHNFKSSLWKASRSVPLGHGRYFGYF